MDTRPPTAMSGIASPPKNVWHFSTKDSGSWMALFTLATFGKFRPGPSDLLVARRAKIAARSGQPEASVRNQLRRLTRGSSDFQALLIPVNPGFTWRIQDCTNDWASERPPAAPPAAVLSADIAPSLKRCLVALYSFADYDGADGFVVWPTIGQLATRSGQTERNIRNQMAKLTKLGLVSRDGRNISLHAVPVAPLAPVLSETQAPVLTAAPLAAPAPLQPSSKAVAPQAAPKLSTHAVRPHRASPIQLPKGYQHTSAPGSRSETPRVTNAQLPAASTRVSDDAAASWLNSFASTIEWVEDHSAAAA